MNWPLPSENLLLIEGNNSFLLVGRAGDPFTLYIETTHEEYLQGVDPDDLIVVSCPEGGPVEPARMLLEMVRRYHIPLVVLPRDHPGTRRLNMVVAVAPSISTNCALIRGTHPEQHLLCSSEELGGILLQGNDGKVTAENLPAGVKIRYVPVNDCF